MNLHDIKNIVELFKGILFMKGLDVYFHDKNLSVKPCTIIGIESDIYCVVAKEDKSERIMIFMMNDDMTEITEGVCGVQTSVYRNELLSNRTQLNLYNLNIDISYKDAVTGEVSFYDRVSFMMEHTIKSIIND